MTENMAVNRAAKALLAMQRYSWEQGITMQAFYEMGDTETAVLLALEAAHRAMDGRPATIGVVDAITDPASCGEVIAWAARETGDKRLQVAAENLKQWVLHRAPRNASGILYHLDTGTEFWADSFYMLPPYLSAIGEHEMAIHQFEGYWKCLYDSKSGLLSHRWDDGAQRFTTSAHWGIGNGWCLMAVARLMVTLPESPEREEIGKKGEALLEAVLSTADSEGNFHYILDDPTTFPELGIAQMAAYTIYRGVHDHWLAPAWFGRAEPLRMKAEAAEDEYGIIQGVCGAPTFNCSGSAPEQQAVFLMMENAWRKFE